MDILSAHDAKPRVLLVTCIVPDTNDAGRAIDQIGGTDQDGREWHLQLHRAVALAHRGVRFAIRSGRTITPLEIVETERGVDYLRAIGGGARLADLPRCTHSRHTPPDLDEDVDDDSLLFENCKQAVVYLREHCPDMLPGRLEPGEEGRPLPIETSRASALLGIAARQAVARSAGLAPLTEQDLPRAIVWTDGADELLVRLDTLEVTTFDGSITVSVDVACDQIAGEGSLSTRISVDLIVGTEARPTGVLAAAPLPRGNPLIVRRWGDALVALAWKAMLDAASGLAAASGADEAGVPLVAFQWTADPDGLKITPQARHLSDRLSALSTLP